MDASIWTDLRCNQMRLIICSFSSSLVDCPNWLGSRRTARARFQTEWCSARAVRARHRSVGCERVSSDGDALSSGKTVLSKSDKLAFPIASATFFAGRAWSRWLYAARRLTLFFLLSSPQRDLVTAAAQFPFVVPSPRTLPVRRGSRRHWHKS